MATAVACGLQEAASGLFGEWDVFPLPLSKVTGPTIGLLKSVLTILQAEF